MSIFGLFRKQRSAPMARERLQILLAHERASIGSDLVSVLRRKSSPSSPSMCRSIATRCK